MFLFNFSSQLVQFCHSADEWMKQDEKNILVLHCKGGKGTNKMKIKYVISNISFTLRHI